MQYQIYQRRNWKGQLQWRWRLRAKNSKSIAVSGEGYFNESDCRDAIDLVRGSAEVPIMEVKK